MCQKSNKIYNKQCKMSVRELYHSFNLKQTKIIYDKKCQFSSCLLEMK